MTADISIDAFWRRYLAAAGKSEAPRKLPEAWSFGDNPALADELCRLVLDGIKTATCSLLWEFETETTQVAIQPFNQVDAAFAYEEGEDDRSLESWRREHWRYFSRTSQSQGWILDENMLLVCERFRVVFQENNK